MSGASDYLDRLKNIREKYGCSQPKGTSNYPTDHYQPADKASLLERPLTYERTTYNRPDLYAADKMKIVDPHIPSAGYGAKNLDYAGTRPASSAGLG